MSEPFYMLEPLRWAGLTEVPAYGAHFVSTPIYVTGVQPLKTGKGLLRIEFAQPLVPGGGLRRTIVGKIVQKARTHLTVLYRDQEEIGEHTAIFALPSLDWLATYCPTLMQRRPLSGPAFLIDGEPVGLPTEHEHLERVFGRNEGDILRGANSTSFKVKLYKLPKEQSEFWLNLELYPFDSCLAVRGYTPTQMEDKWYIYLEDSRLKFRRSWTGYLIYDVETQWREDRLYFGHTRVNRNPTQYEETDDVSDRNLLIYIIYDVICGKVVELPAKDDDTLAALPA